jgi:hypothetical protein
MISPKHRNRKSKKKSKTRLSGSGFPQFGSFKIRLSGITGGTFAALCQCNVLPWEDCVHGDEYANQIMASILSMDHQ